MGVDHAHNLRRTDGVPHIVNGSHFHRFAPAGRIVRASDDHDGSGTIEFLHVPQEMAPLKTRMAPPSSTTTMSNTNSRRRDMAAYWDDTVNEAKPRSWKVRA